MSNYIFQSIPIAYALMESKSRNSYQCVLDFMKANLLPNLNPDIIITDFEPALRDSLLSSLGVRGTRIMGCWFHHNQVDNIILITLTCYIKYIYIIINNL